MRMFVMSIAASIIIALRICIVAAGAQSPSPNALIVTVRDSTGKQFSDVVVVVLGSAPGQAFEHTTDVHGVANFDTLVTGFYEVSVKKAGFQTYRVAVDINSDKSVQLSVTLQNALKQIGSVTASSGVVFRQSIDSRSAIRKISPTIVDAMNRLGGVNAATGASGIGLQSSLEGRDPSQTSYTLNGSPAGSGAALAINTDLLSAAQVQQDHDSVNLSFLSPSTSPQYHNEANVGNFGASFIKATFQGMSGNVGFAAAHTIRGAESALNGMSYEDTSGLTYRHAGALVTAGNMIKLTSALGDWNLSGTDNWSRSRGKPIPAYFGGALPAGYGPNIWTETAASNPLVTLNGSLAGWAISFSAAQWHYRNVDDERGAIIALTDTPMYTELRTDGSDLTISLNKDRNDRRSYSFQASRTVSASSAYQWVGSPSTATLAGATHRQNDISLTQHLRSSPKLQLDEEVALRNLDGGTSYLSAIGSAKWHPTDSESWLLSFNAGTHPIASNNPANFAQLADPRQAQFDCGAGTITLRGPGDARSTASSRRLSLSYSKSLRRAQFSAHAYIEKARNILLSGAAVSLGSEPVGFLSQDYQTALQNAYNAVGACPGQVPSSNIFILQDIAGVSVDYRGFEVTMTSIPIGKAFVASLSYSTTGASLVSRDPRLMSPLSPYIPGAQLPNVPLHKLGGILDWSNSGNTEGLISVDYLSGNNSRNLPAYTLYSIGMVRHISPTLDLVGVATNVTSRFEGLFVTSRYAVSLPTYSGNQLSTLAAPIGPSRIFLGIQFHLDRDVNAP